MNKSNNIWPLFLCCLSVTLLLSSCTEKEKGINYYDYFAVQLSKGDSWSIIDKNGQVVVDEEYPSDALISPIHQGSYWVRQGDTYQLFNIQNPKRPLIDDEFTRATRFKAGVSAVSNPNEQIRLIGTDGKVIAMLPKDIRRCYSFSEYGYAIIVGANGLHGVIDSQGKIIIQPSYSDIWQADNLLLAQKEMDDTDIVILDMQGKQLGSFSKTDFSVTGYGEGKLVAKDRNGDYIVFDKTMKVLFPLKKAAVGSAFYVDGHVVFCTSDGKYGIADDKGETVIRPKYEDMEIIGDNLFAARKGEKWGIVDSNDETVIGFEYDGYRISMGSNFIMSDGDTYVMIDRKGKEVMAFDYWTTYYDDYAEYVDVESLAHDIVETISQYEKAPKGEEMAQRLSLDIDDCHYQYNVIDSKELDGKVKLSTTIYYDDPLAMEQKHDVTENDGWFDYTYTVSDGWHWRDQYATSAHGSIDIIDKSVNAKDLLECLNKLMFDGRRVAEGNTYVSDHNEGEHSFETYTTLTLLGDDNIGVGISFSFEP